VALDLVDGGCDLVVFDQVDEPVAIEVCDTDRADQTFALQVLHRAPRAVVVAERLVDQIQVDVVEAEPLQRSLEAAPCLHLAGVLCPELGRDEQLLARNATRGDRPADGLLVAIRGGGVERAVAGPERLRDDLFGLLGRNLEDAEAE
jgi:hypothetical protein